MLVIGKHLFGAGHVAGGAFNFNRVSFQVNGYVQAVFKQVQVFVTSTEESFNVGTDSDVLLHLGFGVSLRSAIAHN